MLLHSTLEFVPASLARHRGLRLLGVVSFESNFEASIMVVDRGFEFHFAAIAIMSGSATVFKCSLVDIGAFGHLPSNKQFDLFLQ